MTWWLSIVLLSAAPGVQPITKLRPFSSYAHCKIERDRVGYEMAAAYPYEPDFRIACLRFPH